MKYQINGLKLILWIFILFFTIVLIMFFTYDKLYGIIICGVMLGFLTFAILNDKEPLIKKKLYRKNRKNNI